MYYIATPVDLLPFLGTLLRQHPLKAHFFRTGLCMARLVPPHDRSARSPEPRERSHLSLLSAELS